MANEDAFPLIPLIQPQTPASAQRVLQVDDMEAELEGATVTVLHSESKPTKTSGECRPEGRHGPS